MDHSILAHHYAGASNLKGFTLSDAYITRKYNGWNITFDGGLSLGLQNKMLPWYSMKGSKLDNIVSSGLWTLGRSNGPRPLYPPKWWIDPIKQAFKDIPVQGELWHTSDNIEHVKRIAGQGYTTSQYDIRWNELYFIPCNIRTLRFWCQKELKSLMDRRIGSELYQMIDDKPLWYKIKAINNAILNYLQVNLTNGFNIKMPETVPICDEEGLYSLLNTCSWEGLMIANPAGYYTLGRSYDLLKLKKEYESEAVTVGYEPGEKGNIGKIGSLTCRLTWDEKVLSIYGGQQEMVGKTIIFGVSGLNQEERNIEKFSVGSVIKFSFKGVTTDGIPVSANIYRGK